MWLRKEFGDPKNQENFCKFSQTFSRNLNIQFSAGESPFLGVKNESHDQADEVEHHHGGDEFSGRGRGGGFLRAVGGTHENFKQFLAYRGGDRPRRGGRRFAQRWDGGVDRRFHNNSNNNGRINTILTKMGKNNYFLISE